MYSGELFLYLHRMRFAAPLRDIAYGASQSLSIVDYMIHCWHSHQRGENLSIFLNLNGEYLLI